MILNGRLKAIADAVPPSAMVADIGTDHGYIPVYLVKNNITQGAVAADISKGSLKKAECLISQHGLGKVIDSRLGSGLSVLNLGEVDTIIIAGMGGLLIRDIIADSFDIAFCARALILQPMVAQDVLRKWLLNNGFRITDEDLVKEEQRIYEIITATPGHQVVAKEIYYDIGYKLIEKQHPLLEELVLKRITGLEEIMERLNRGNTYATQKRAEEVKNKLRQYKEVYRWDIQSKKL